MGVGDVFAREKVCDFGGDIRVGVAVHYADDERKSFGNDFPVFLQNFRLGELRTESNHIVVGVHQTLDVLLLEPRLDRVDDLETLHQLDLRVEVFGRGDEFVSASLNAPGAVNRNVGVAENLDGRNRSIDGSHSERIEQDARKNHEERYDDVPNSFAQNHHIVAKRAVGHTVAHSHIGGFRAVSAVVAAVPAAAVAVAAVSARAVAVAAVPAAITAAVSVAAVPAADDDLRLLDGLVFVGLCGGIRARLRFLLIVFVVVHNGKIPCLKF